MKLDAVLRNRAARNVFTTALLLFVPFFTVQGDRIAVQTARSLPVSHEVDLLVVGGTVGGVAAACEAAGQGAKVLLVTQYPYLGEDRTATLRLSGETGEDRNDPLHAELLDDPNRNADPEFSLRDRIRRAERIGFTYRIDEPIDASHPETTVLGRLVDGVFENPVTDSLQVNGNATITVDLGEKKDFRQIILMAFIRDSGEKPFQVDRVEMSVSDDGAQWATVDRAFQPIPLKSTSPDGRLHPFVMTSENAISARHLKIHATKNDSSKRILLGELLVLANTLDDVPAAEAEPAPPRPMHVKHTLDNRLLQAGVPFLFNTFKVGDIEDGEGKCFGAVISHRGGRQAVLAKAVLDARPGVSSLKTAQYVVIGADPKKIDLADYPLLKSCSSEIMGRPFVAARRQHADSTWTNEYPIVNYTFQLELLESAEPNDIALRAEIEKQIRLAAYSPDQSFTADEIYYPQTFKPLSIWRRQGRELAARTKTIEFPSPDKLAVAGRKTSGTVVPGDVREILVDLRMNAFKGDGSAVTIDDPERSLPVLGTYDVVVVGGGTSGAPAGIAAGRQGAKTLVLEHLHDLGGIGTAGAISKYWYGNVAGFTKEVQDGLRRWSIESKIFWWRNKLAESGAEVWYGILAGGALVMDGRIRGVLVATPFGPGIVEAEVVIDATGNGDIAIAAGAAIQSYDDREIAVQGAGLAPRDLGASYRNTDFMFVDDNDILDSSHVFVYAKEKYPHAFDQAKLLSTRERRQILGEFSFTVLDQINNRTYPDSIVLGYSDYDTHGYTIDPYMELNHPYRTVVKPDGKKDRTDRIYAYVPYRSSIPKGLDGILVVGLAMSSHRDALPVVRMQPDLQNQGYAIGCAAAMLSKEPEKNVRDLDVKALQEHLTEIGNLSTEVTAHRDNYGKGRERIPATVDTLPEHFRESVPLVMWYPDDSRPLVHEAYLKETDFERKLIYAKVAAALGDSVGVPTILKKLESYDRWDKGWEFTGMGQAGTASSPMDQWIMMLGRLGDPRAVDAIVKKAKNLTKESDFSHFRSIALALEKIGEHESARDKAARALADLLAMPGMTGYVHDSIEKAKYFDELGGRTDMNQEKARRDSLVEISLARALYRCGDVNGKGETILRAYTKDLRGYFARHALKVLDSRHDTTR